MLVLPPFLTRLFASQKSTLPPGEGTESGPLKFSRPLLYTVKGLIFFLYIREKRNSVTKTLMHSAMG